MKIASFFEFPGILILIGIILLLIALIIGIIGFRQTSKTSTESIIDDDNFENVDMAQAPIKEEVSEEEPVINEEITNDIQPLTEPIVDENNIIEEPVKVDENFDQEITADINEPVDSVYGGISPLENIKLEPIAEAETLYSGTLKEQPDIVTISNIIKEPVKEEIEVL